MLTFQSLDFFSTIHALLFYRLFKYKQMESHRDAQPHLPALFFSKGKKGEKHNLSSVREKNSKCLFIFLLNAEDVFSGSHKAHLC